MNTQIFLFFHYLAGRAPFLDKTIIFFAMYFPYIVVILAGIFFLIHFKIFKGEGIWFESRKRWREFILFSLIVLIPWGIGRILKSVFHTARPFDAIPNVHSLFPEVGYAFPSDHTIFFTALGMAVYSLNKRVGSWFLLFAFVIGIARIAAGVHFPGDILGGLIIGILASFLVLKVSSSFAYFKKNV
jgi:undecaprenyl-diphosphatase